MNVILACLGITAALWAWLYWAVRFDAEHAPEPVVGHLVCRDDEEEAA
jgi:hypothetical protein